MSQTLATIFGAFILCIWPLLWFAFGVYYTRYGSPIRFTWRGFGRAIEDEDDVT